MITKKRAAQAKKSKKPLTAVKKSVRSKVSGMKTASAKKTAAKKTASKKTVGKKSTALKTKATKKPARLATKSKAAIPSKSLRPANRKKLSSAKKQKTISTAQPSQEMEKNDETLLQEASTAQIPESVIQDGSAPQGGIPYKNEEYVSSAAINKDAKTAKGLSKPRGTSTHTFTAANHSRRSSSHKQ